MPSDYLTHDQTKHRQSIKPPQSQSTSSLNELKLRQKLLTQQISVISSKLTKANDILEIKKQAKGDFSGINKKTPHELHEQQKQKYLTKISSPKKKFTSQSIMRGPDMLPALPLMVPKVIEPGSTFDQVRKRNILRHQSHILTTKLKKKPEDKPIKSGVFKINTSGIQSLLVRRYTRGELPCTLEHRSSGLALSWMCPLSNLDYNHYLPIFMDGIRCTTNPYKFIARRGVYELINDAIGDSDRIIENLAAIITPVRYALATKIPDVVKSVVDILTQLCTSHPSIGPALIPHYRTLLGTLNLFFLKGGNNLGDAMEYGGGSEDMVVSISEMLGKMEETGGDGAFKFIKKMVPTYSSVFAEL